ncbi:hypothetical protein AgCh_032788 [Apium graveolens]
MAHRHTYHPQHTNHSAGVKSLLPKKTPSTSQVLAVVTLLLVSGTPLFLAGITLIETLIGLVVATLLFIIFSSIFVPAALSGFLGFRAFGLTGLSSLSPQAQFSQMRRVAIPPTVAHRMPMYPPGAAGFGQQLFYGQGPPAMFPSQETFKSCWLLVLFIILMAVGDSGNGSALSRVTGNRGRGGRGRNDTRGQGHGRGNGEVYPEEENDAQGSDEEQEDDDAGQCDGVLTFGRAQRIICDGDYKKKPQLGQPKLGVVTFINGKK